LTEHRIRALWHKLVGRSDPDDEALRRVACSGSNMALPMNIDFAIALQDERSGAIFAELARSRGYRTDVCWDEESKEWSYSCTRTMLATYDGIISAQRELDELCRPHGGHTDGWATLGNK
jgi:hypothetical protein